MESIVSSPQLTISMISHFSLNLLKETAVDETRNLLSGPRSYTRTGNIFQKAIEMYQRTNIQGYFPVLFNYALSMDNSKCLVCNLFFHH